MLGKAYRHEGAEGVQFSNFVANTSFSDNKLQILTWSKIWIKNYIVTFQHFYKTKSDKVKQQIYGGTRKKQEKNEINFILFVQFP